MIEIRYGNKVLLMFLFVGLSGQGELFVLNLMMGGCVIFICIELDGVLNVVFFMVYFNFEQQISGEDLLWYIVCIMIVVVLDGVFILLVKKVLCFYFCNFFKNE